MDSPNNNAAADEVSQQNHQVLAAQHESVSSHSGGAAASHHSSSSAPSIQDQLHDLATFTFPRPPDPEEDPTGRAAFRAASERIDAATRQTFLRFPSQSVIERLDASDTARFAHCGLGDKGMAALADALRVNHAVTAIDLSDNGLTYAGLKSCLAALTKNIRTVDLSENRLTRGSIISLSKDMPSVLAQQMGLLGGAGGGNPAASANNNNSTAAAGGGNNNNNASNATAPSPAAAASINTFTYFTGVSQTGCAGYALGQMLAKNTTLTGLSLRATKLNDTDCSALADGLQENATLLSLDLSHNDLGAGSVMALTTILMRSELRELNLEWNKLQNSGAVLMIKEGLPVTTVKRLLLGWNGLGDEAAVELGKCLAGSSPLEEIDVSNNNIGLKGAEGIAKGVRGSMALTALIVHDNPLTDEGCMSLLKAISDNATLIAVDMRETGAGENAAAMLPPILAAKPPEFTIDMPRSAARVEDFRGQEYSVEEAQHELHEFHNAHLGEM